MDPAKERSAVPEENDTLLPEDEADTLRCSNCQRVLQDVLLLRCSHHLCLICGANAVSHGHKARKLSLGEPHVSCPTCGETTVLEAGALAALARESNTESGLKAEHPDAALRDIAARSSAHSPTNRSRPVYDYVCGICRKSVATVFCYQCVDYFCDSCVTNTHNENSLQEKHEFVELATCDPARLALIAPPLKSKIDDYSHIRTQPLPPGVPHTPANVSTEGVSRESDDEVLVERSCIASERGSQLASVTDLACMEHPKDPVRYFCYTCETSCVCAECVVSGVHNTHQVQKTGDAWDLVEGKVVDEWMNQVTGLTNECDAVQAFLQDKRIEWATAIHQCQEHFQIVVERLKEKIAQREEEVLQQFKDFTTTFVEESAGFGKVVSSKISTLDDAHKDLRNYKSMVNPVAMLEFYAEHPEDVRNCRRRDHASLYSHLPLSRQEALQYSVHEAAEFALKLNTLREQISSAQYEENDAQA